MDINEPDIEKIILKDDKDIIDTIGMAELPLIVWIFDKKYNGQVQLIDIGGDCMIRYGETNIANMSYLATYLHKIEITDSYVSITGNVSIPYIFKDACNFYAVINNKKVNVEFFDANLDRKLSNDHIFEIRTAFNLNCQIDNELNISFGISTNGIDSICGKLNCMRFMPVSDVIRNQYSITDNGWLIQILDEKLIISRHDGYLSDLEDKYNKELLRIAENDNSKNIEIHEALVRRKKYFEYLENNNSPIWLFFDRIDKADDNGEVLFEYSIRNCPDKISYYVIDKNCKDYIRLREKYGLNIVEAMSDRHKDLLLRAEYIFTSQMNGFVENPFGDAAEYYRDIYHKPKLVFLQHGVTKDDQTDFLGSINQNIYAIIASSISEKEEFCRSEYGLEEGHVWTTGMPRFDRLTYDRAGNILIMPTWRKNIMHLEKDEYSGLSRWVMNDGYENSDYIKNIKRLLNSVRLKTICNIFGLGVLFVPHPLTRNYSDMFDCPEWIRIPDYNESYNDIFSESCMMVTDYSSVAFDYAVTKKPVIYYQFDADSFYEGHTYKKGYFDYNKDGFGKVVYKLNGLLAEILHLICRNLRPEKIYDRRRKNFFVDLDGNCCRNIISNAINGVYDKNEQQNI